ncbi:hypothetical protein PT974_06297 [Cladobotryum mycophilum]|uniref:Uncharacterized protein n=1 Tax=Cladobotryum mycophilum TaxID=491253 RepID=A0ABR0SL43_9HYPO
MPQSRLSRALWALPILAMGIPMHRVLLFMLDPLGPAIEKFTDQATFEMQNGTTVPLITNYYGIPAVDAIFSQASIFFSYFLTYDVPVTYWQSLIFLTDLAPIVLVTSLLGQILGMGNLSPAYHYFLYIFSPVEKLAANNGSFIDEAGVASVLAVIPLYLIPHFLSFFHPNLGARLWWNWLWQLFPLWCSLTLFVLTRVIPSTPLLGAWVKFVRKNNRIVIMVILSGLTLVTTSVYLYSLITSGFSPYELFIPNHFWKMPETPGDSVKAFMHYDYISCISSPLLWLAYSLYELKTEGGGKISWLQVCLDTLITAALGGPGSLVVITWMRRERVLFSMKNGKSG